MKYSLNNLPKFYHSSELYKLLLETTNDVNEKLIDEQFVYDINKDKINNRENFEKLMTSFRFFGINYIDNKILHILIDIYLNCYENNTNVYDIIDTDKCRQTFALNPKNEVKHIFEVINFIKKHENEDVYEELIYVHMRDGDYKLLLRIIDYLYNMKNTWSHLHLQIACCFDKLEWLQKKTINFNKVKISYLIEVAVSCANDRILKYLLEKYDTNNENHHVYRVMWYIRVIVPEHEKCRDLLEEHNFYVYYDYNNYPSILIEDMTLEENVYSRCLLCHSTNNPCDCYIDNAMDDYY